MSRHARAARFACFDIALTIFIGLAFTAPSTAKEEKRYDPGASDAIIKIGNTAPYSGPLSSEWHCRQNGRRLLQDDQRSRRC
jgi:branched-chain amino acid transport system substrate-binding protein